MSRSGDGLRIPKCVRAQLCCLGTVFSLFGCAPALAGETSPSRSAPLKIAVFPFALEDFSAAGSEGAAPDETAYLADATKEAKQQLERSGRYIVVDAVEPNAPAIRDHNSLACIPCDVQTAAALGADQLLLGAVTKISMTEYRVRIQVRNVQSSEIIATYATDLRVGAHYAWNRGVRWLMQNQILVQN